MFVSYLKFTGFVLWGLFLFIPFAAQAEERVDAFLIFDSATVEESQGNIFTIPADDQWSLMFNVGKDSVLSNDLPSKIQHDRIPLDDGERESIRFGVGLNYKF